MKRIFFFIVALLTFLFPGISFAQTNDMSISSFVREDCTHCQEQKAFFEEVLAKEYPNLKFRYYDISEEENYDLFIEVTDRYGVVKGTPVTLVRDQLMQGFDSAETSGARIRDVLANGTGPFATMENIRDGGATVYTGFSGQTCPDEGCLAPQSSYTVLLPFIGKEVDVGRFSLGAMSLILGFVDGFNPCAMWVLVMFIMVLSQLNSRRKMWQYVGIFILAEALMYYGILTVWLTAWDFIGLHNIVTPIIGLLALGSGAYFMYKFITYTPVCSVASPQQQKKIGDRVKELAKKPMTIGVFFGILLLAFSVNIFEFACSIGIPQTFTKILDLNGLSWLVRQGYLLLYIFTYMIDDLIVFGIALWGIEKIGITQKYSRWATLIGSLAMIALGIIMLWKPELLIF